MLKTIREIASSLIFPKVCETCDNLLPVRDALGVCAACRDKLLKIKPPFCAGCGRTSARENTRCGQCGRESFRFDRAYAATFYEGKMRELLRAFKFHERKSLKKIFVDILDEFISNHLNAEDFDVIVSVPMDGNKENQRGFNQAGVLSRAIAKKINKKELSVFFKKKKSRQTQSLLTKSQRARNILGSFYVKNQEVFRNKTILLVDDILTTGFTASECAKTLKESGAARVTVLAVARGL